MNFTGKRVVVTGAAGIFGSWIATAFAKAGATLCLSDVRRDRLDALPAKLGANPATTLLHATELRDEASIKALAALVEEKWGAPDILVNNAGLYPRTGILLDLDVAEWDRMMDVNVRAPFLVTRAMARLMIAKGVHGAIVNIGSGASRKMRIGSVPYCTSKMALERLTKGQALELAPHRIRVNVVEPGFAPGSEVSPLPDEYVAMMKARIPLGHTSGPEDTPGAVLFLCSDGASFITGAVLAVDGGNSIAG